MLTVSFVIMKKLLYCILLIYFIAIYPVNLNHYDVLKGQNRTECAEEVYR